MSEIKRFDAVHLRYEEDNIRYREGCEVEVVTARDYDALAAELERAKATIDGMNAEHWKAVNRVAELEALINNPHTDDWFEGVRLEAAHQVERWGQPHDQGKSAVDWVFLIGHLATKAALAALAGDITKAKHHTISTAAVCLNWFRSITGENTAMRPGIEES